MPVLRSCSFRAAEVHANVGQTLQAKSYGPYGRGHSSVVVGLENEQQRAVENLLWAAVLPAFDTVLSGARKPV